METRENKEKLKLLCLQIRQERKQEKIRKSLNYFVYKYVNTRLDCQRKTNINLWSGVNEEKI